MKKSKVVVSFSGGKDSTLSLYRVINSGYEVVGLISTFEEGENTCFHKIPKNIMDKISKSLNIPIIIVECNKDTIYEEEFEKALNYAKKIGAEGCVFGDIDIECHKKWGVDRCNNVDMKSLFPLWQEDREKIVNEFINCNFKAIIKKVNTNYLSVDFLGKLLTSEIVKEIKENGSDPCGENGEYHTVVIDGPIFSNPINIKAIDKEVTESFGYLKITCEE